jgi:hypothetical protein
MKPSTPFIIFLFSRQPSAISYQLSAISFTLLHQSLCVSQTFKTAPHLSYIFNSHELADG